MNYIVGAYAASPALHEWDPRLEQEYFASLAELPLLRGLELPWISALHPHDESWLLEHLPPHLDLVVTDVPGTVRRVSTDPSFGLASRDEEGRKAAVHEVARMRDDVHRLVETAGRQRVIAVELHSAPRRALGDPSRFARSLAEIASWDWAGADLVVEHCDSEVDGHEPAKGWMSLADEIAALVGTGVGLSLNWGRSAIELRDGDAVAGQIRLARDSGTLRGLIFSGAADRDDDFGSAWEDAHLPFTRRTGFPLGSAASLLTTTRVEDAVVAAGELEWIGLKFGWPGRDGSVAARVEMIETALTALDRVVTRQENSHVR